MFVNLNGTTLYTIWMYNTIQYNTLFTAVFRAKERWDIAESYSGFTNEQLEGLDILRWYDNNINIYTYIWTYWYLAVCGSFLIMFVTISCTSQAV